MPRKKIKDLTLEEQKKICLKNKCNKDCPLAFINICIHTPYSFREEDLEKEIDVEDDEIIYNKSVEE